MRPATLLQYYSTTVLRTVPYLSPPLRESVCSLGGQGCASPFAPFRSPGQPPAQPVREVGDTRDRLHLTGALLPPYASACRAAALQRLLRSSSLPTAPTPPPSRPSQSAATPPVPRHPPHPSIASFLPVLSSRKKRRRLPRERTRAPNPPNCHRHRCALTMHPSANPLLLLSALVVLLLCAPVQAFAVPWAGSSGSFAATQRHTGQPLSKHRSVFPQLTWLRDTAIEKVFGLPPKTTKPGCDKTILRPVSSPLPSTLLAKYGGDVVLRFNLSTSSEERALAEAADTLFLDVWEFTGNWADIHLREDDVCLITTPRQASANRSGSVTPWITSQVPANSLLKPYARPGGDYLPILPIHHLRRILISSNPCTSFHTGFEGVKWCR